MAVNNDNLAQALYTRLTRYNAAIAARVDENSDAMAAGSSYAKKVDGQIEKLGTSANALLNALKGAPADSTAALDSYAAKAGNVEAWSSFPGLAGLHAATVGRTLSRISAARPDLAPLATSVRAALDDVHAAVI